MRAIMWLIVLVFFVSVFYMAKQIQQSRVEIEGLRNQLTQKEYMLDELKAKYNTDVILQEAQNPIELEVQECMKKQNYTTVGMSYCVDKSIESWEKEIDKYLKLLETKLTSSQYEALGKSQKQWILYKDMQWQVIDEIMKDCQGSICLNLISGKKAELVKSRAIYLQSVYNYCN